MKRLYNISILVLLQHARIVIELLKQDLDVFATQDSSFNAAKITELQDLLNEANQLPDKSILDEQADLTQQFLELIEDGKQHYKELFYFIRKAFNSQITIQNLLGKNTFSAAKRNQLAFIQFFKVLNDIQPNYEADLLAAGAKPALLERTTILCQKIEAISTKREIFKRERQGKTVYRVEKVNDLYVAMSNIERLALLVYQDNISKIKAYTIPRANRNKKITTTPKR
ncbi:MAG: hypothetical protein JNM36_10155 [Chitinophagales bacterium]|nr:hypothetical protein [Chitinophagales bacterium]